MLVTSALRHNVPRYFATGIGAAWLAAFVATNLYRQHFRCPRCHHYFYPRGSDFRTEHCAHCGLRAGSPGADPTPSGG
jgi:ribosomal protein L37E